MLAMFAVIAIVDSFAPLAFGKFLDGGLCIALVGEREIADSVFRLLLPVASLNGALIAIAFARDVVELLLCEIVPKSAAKQASGEKGNLSAAVTRGSYASRSCSTDPPRR